MADKRKHSNSVINYGHNYSQRLAEKDSLYAGDSLLESYDAKKEGSFSYLPSIVGVGRSKNKPTDYHSSVDLQRRKYGIGSLNSMSGKQPLLLANHRSKPGFVGAKSSLSKGSIRMVDPVKARDLVKEQSIDHKKLAINDIVGSKTQSKNL